MHREVRRYFAGNQGGGMLGIQGTPTHFRGIRYAYSVTTKWVSIEKY